MFKFNTIQVTKDGEKLMPFSADGEIVSCFTQNKKVVYRQLSDFDFTPPKSKKEVIVVQPAREKATDQLFTPEEDNSVDEDIVEPDTTTDNGSTTEPDTTDNGSTTEPEDTDNGSTTEPEDTDNGSTTEPDSNNGGSIWDTIDDDNYI